MNGLKWRHLQQAVPIMLSQQLMSYLKPTRTSHMCSRGVGANMLLNGRRHYRADLRSHMEQAGPGTCATFLLHITNVVGLLSWMVLRSAHLVSNTGGWLLSVLVFCYVDKGPSRVR